MWREWLAQMASRYEPEEKSGPTIHGLRGTGFLARFAAGYDVDQVANDTGATAQTVAGYMRFRDQMQVAADGCDWWTRAGQIGGRPRTLDALYGRCPDNGYVKQRLWMCKTGSGNPGKSMPCGGG
jgi:hypothetical protein